MSEVMVKGLVKRFKDKKVLDEVNIRFPRGSLTVVLGPPGSGKTTLLRIIAGVERPDNGEVYIDDSNVTDVPPSKRDVAMVFQTLAVYPNMTVYENIASPLRLRGYKEEDVRKRVKEVADLLHISHLLERVPVNLSGGEVQRVAIARAIVRRPKVYLFDEPFINLDAKIRSELRNELRELKERLKQTIIFATPDPLEALSLGDYIVVINDGKVIQMGTPQQIYFRPANAFVAEYVGNPSINLLEGEVKTSEDKLLFVGEGIKIAIPRSPLKIIEGGKVIIGIRPEDISLSPSEPISNLIKLHGEVYTMEILGADTILHVKVGGLLIRVLLPYMYRPEIGSKVDLYIHPSKIYFFDAKTLKLIEG